MAEGSGASNTLAGVIIGAILVIAVGVGVYAFTGGRMDSGPEIHVEAPEVPSPS